jgi:ElaB/YqjD/DUF883 family membrane-anchored ribosome-binding protein
MSSTEGLERKAKNGIDRAEAAASDAIDDTGAKVKGEAKQFADRADAATGAAKDIVGTAADRARAAVSDVCDRAAGAYAELRTRAQDVSATVDPFVRESPYLAAAVAALAGVIVGALCFGGSKVVYLKSSRD